MARPCDLQAIGDQRTLEGRANATPSSSSGKAHHLPTTPRPVPGLYGSCSSRQGVAFARSPRSIVPLNRHGHPASVPSSTANAAPLRHGVPAPSAIVHYAYRSTARSRLIATSQHEYEFDHAKRVWRPKALTMRKSRNCLTTRPSLSCSTFAYAARCGPKPRDRQRYLTPSHTALRHTDWRLG